MAYLVPIIGWNRDFADRHAGGSELDNNVGVKIEPQARGAEWHSLQRGCSIRPVSAMHLAKLGPDDPILQPCQNPISQELVERHTPPKSAALRKETASIDRIRAAWFRIFSQDIRQGFGRVLPISMEQNHDIETSFERV